MELSYGVPIVRAYTVCCHGFVSNTDCYDKVLYFGWMFHSFCSLKVANCHDRDIQVQSKWKF